MSARTVYLSTYPPRRCGIATFAADLRAAVGGHGDVVALRSPDGSTDEAIEASGPVRAVLAGHEPGDYRDAADRIDGWRVDAVSVQHEYGIYGGPDGINLLAFAERVRTPVVTTFHTILGRPSDRQRCANLDALGATLAEVLANAELRTRTSRSACAFGRTMTRPTVGAAYRRLFASVAGTRRTTMPRALEASRA